METNDKRKFYQQNGYIVLKSFVPGTQMEKLKKASMNIKNDANEHFERHDGSYLKNSEIKGGVTGYYRSGVMNLHIGRSGLGKTFSDTFINIFCSKQSFEQLNSIFDFGEYTIHQTILFFTSPLTIPHLDRMSLDTTPTGNSFTCWLSIDKTTSENGAVYLKPNPVGSFAEFLEKHDDIVSYRNAFAEQFEEKQEDLVIPELEPGDLLIFASSTPHGSLKPKNKSERCGMQIIIRSTEINRWGKYPNHEEPHNIEEEECKINNYFSYLKIK